MAILGRELLKIPDAKIERVEVPEWGGEVCIRVMTGLERDRFEHETRPTKEEPDVRNHENFRAKFCAAVLCDETGHNLFGPLDVAALGQKSSTALERIFDAGLELNGMRAKAAESLEKNSDGTSSGEAVSGSASPSANPT